MQAAFGATRKGEISWSGSSAWTEVLAIEPSPQIIREADGVGRAPGSDKLTAKLLNPNLYASDEFPQKIIELKAWVDGEELPSNHLGHRDHVYHATETHPTFWVLGSSDYGAQLAAYLGLNYAFAHFITNGAGTKEAFDLYRNNFKPNGENQKPCSIVCVWALAAET